MTLFILIILKNPAILSKKTNQLFSHKKSQKFLLHANPPPRAYRRIWMFNPQTDSL
jgi:hypothetical protein